MDLIQSSSYPNPSASLVPAGGTGSYHKTHHLSLPPSLGFIFPVGSSLFSRGLGLRDLVGEMKALFAANQVGCYPSLAPSRFLRHSRRFWSLKELRRVDGMVIRSPRCSMDVSLGSYNYENIPKFPRMNVWDPYKRLGVSHDASAEEIREARNFLLEQYAGHERSMESIEAAYEKILMASFRERKKTKINLKSRLKKKVEESPPWVKTLISFIELPPADIILRRLFLFAFMGAWSIMNSAESGPAFQVALSLLACIYFLNDKMKNVVRASLTGFGALVVGWIVGSILVPMIPSVLLQPTWTLELLTSLVSYVFMFLACTFLK